MKRTPSPNRLGATLYMPATRPDLAEVVLHNKIPGLRSLVFCLEDAVSDKDVGMALENLRTALPTLAAQMSSCPERPLLFIRPRHAEMGAQLTGEFCLDAVDGFVLPKFTHASMEAWWRVMANTHLCMMPTLETEEVFDVKQMTGLADALDAHPCHERIIALRIGGNDLMNVISMRRSRDFTLYDGPMGYIIKMLVAVFGARNYALTAPVCEHIDDLQLLKKELALDVAHGLVGKTAIHPNQIDVIQRALMVTPGDHADALRILNSTQAVFKSQGAMCEPATHKRWALTVLERAQHYGIVSASGETARVAPAK
ncbi:HpcH/HpaI aldolase/citrate lyase family protein [Enterobacillus tribolii]|uniref:Citrate lyase beta subunit n=1 Tax=Enterobacillus tribolii TaxID=1487935 RepID=A0A370R1N6_9GAMM|nr:HpcH/HpaI aldolase/citrate lyase family protein [Enterobacillus tribolii]MBW7983091.1 citrate lyase subunit beta [Enterobacillus tribolii]RDK95805.1 citrate lyase beta subunit [Enterobacillus tribolii]